MTDVNTAGGSLSLTLLDGADVTPLFSPVSVAGLKLRNRLAMAPLTPSGKIRKDVLRDQLTEG